MYVKKWVIFASMMVAASLPAYGNSSTPVSQDLLPTRAASTMIGERLPMKTEASFVFRNTLQDVRGKGSGLLAPWDTSRPTEIPREQERSATLPETNTGILFVIGLLTLGSLAGMRSFAHKASCGRTTSSVCAVRNAC
jgi:hypothetical protein